MTDAPLPQPYLFLGCLHTTTVTLHTHSITCLKVDYLNN